MKASWTKIVCVVCVGLVGGGASQVSAGPIRGIARAAVRSAAGGGGDSGGLVRNLAGTAAKIAVQQAIPGGNSIKKQLLGTAAEIGVKGGLKVLSQIRQGGGQASGFAGGISTVACPSTYYAAPRNSIPTQYYGPSNPGEVVVSETIVETVEPAAPEAVEAPAPAAVDLKLISVKLVNEGDQKQGPGYRLTVQNVGRTEANSEITVVLLASMEKDSDENVSAIGSITGLKVGETKSVELRLPPGSQVLRHLTAAVAPTTLADADETDNIASFER